MTGPRVGVLAVQGDIAEHATVLSSVGAQPVPVRRPEELAHADALVLPGGESTTIIRLLRVFDLLEPLRVRIAGGLPVLGSCAGMILLADRLAAPDEGQPTVGGMDMTVRRNAFGRQVDSFEADLGIEGVTDGGPPMRAVFIRAPWVEKAGADVHVLAEVSIEDVPHPVVVAQDRLVATAFHPELTGDARLHAWFLRRNRIAP
ncbi:MAG: pyridoxal 5'-phosphate synthase glutaminase subunit PdxT [Micrococcales bacterium]|nr:MAG: pyridoxal 5'-phosphate synthase glutaminase subunit PdxT [Micrococcales bacterium]